MKTELYLHAAVNINVHIHVKHICKFSCKTVQVMMYFKFYLNLCFTVLTIKFEKMWHKVISCIDTLLIWIWTRSRLCGSNLWPVHHMTLLLPHTISSSSSCWAFIITLLHICDLIYKPLIAFYQLMGRGGMLMVP